MAFQAPARWLDLNADLGEGVTDDEALLTLVTSANVACGYHAGDEPTMRAVCEAAHARGVAIGAQVSYDDRAHFGRRHLDVPSDVLTAQVKDQWDTLNRIAAEVGAEVGYLKPHGALYNRVVVDPDQAQAVLDAVPGVTVLGLPGGFFVQRAQEQGHATVLEGFPDRGYDSYGRLLPRTEPGAVLDEPEQIARAALRFARDAPQIASLCIHGDGAYAVQAAHEVRNALLAAGISLRPFAGPRG